ncbi:MAG: hypothetical protein H8D22_03045 [Candidatus Cloacimonetes bacterium]|nr:hypothetical protein [Candidatus Cloacimonadota bacterium]
MKNIWIKTIIIIVILVPISIFLHETGHWLIYELNAMDSWMSLQRANLVNPEHLTEGIFLKSLFGGPILTILLALISYLLLTKFRESVWLLVLGLINATGRILPTIIGILTSFKTDLNGVSDEGNIALRITNNVFIREIIMLLLLSLFIFMITRFYKTFKFPDNFKQKKIFVSMICLLSILISLIYPKLDQIIFGI